MQGKVTGKSHVVTPYQSKGYRLFRKLLRNGYKYAEAMSKLCEEQQKEARAGMAYCQRTNKDRKNGKKKGGE